MAHAVQAGPATEHGMKGSFGVEDIGLTSSEERLARQLGTIGSVARSRRPWMAELTGLCPVDGFARRPLRPKRDYAEANSRGTRGVWCFWTLEAGRVYETRYRTTWTKWHHRFLIVTTTGDVEDVSEGQVRAWLANVTSA